MFIDDASSQGCFYLSDVVVFTRMAPATKTLTIENIVASTNIHQELDVEMVALDLHVDYGPEKFPGLIYRIEIPKATSSIFRSGEIVCTGAQSIDDATAALEVTVAELQRLGMEVPDESDIVVHNSVSSGDLEQQLNLNAIAIGLGLEHIEYEPEQFPGLIYRPEELSIAILLFGSGKIVITGGKRVEDAEDAIEALAVKLERLELL